MYDIFYSCKMKTLNVSEFREQCLQLLDGGLPVSGILITKRGRPVAKITPVPASCTELIASVKDLIIDPEDDLFSSGIAWNAESGYSHSIESAGTKSHSPRKKRSRSQGIGY